MLIRVANYYAARIRSRLIWAIALIYLPNFLFAQQSVEVAVFGADTTVSLQVGGVLDAINTRKYQHESISRYSRSGVENNISFSLENKGARDVINPGIEINGKRMIYTAGDLLGRIPLNDLSTIDDTVKVIWNFLWDNYYHELVSTEAGTYQVKPVRTFNVYGAGHCENVTQVFCSMLKQLGYRNVFPIVLNDFHTVGLLNVNGRSIVLDADLKTLYTRRDNRTLADIDSVIWDRELAGRQHHGGFEKSEAVSDEDIARGYTDLKRTGYLNNYQHWSTPDTMYLRIRPNEQVVFNYDAPVGDYFSYYHTAYHENSDAILPNSSLGAVKYQPVFSSDWLNSIAYAENAVAGDSVLYAADSGKAASLVIDFKTPYVWTNGKIVLSYSKITGGSLRISARKDDQHDYTVLYEPDSLFSGNRTDTINLFEFVRPNNYPYKGDPMTNLYYVKIEWVSESSRGITIDSLCFENNFQLNPNALPRLNRGANAIRIADQDGEPFEGLIYSHTYKEINDYAVPVPPDYPMYPGNGDIVNSSQFEFVWGLPAGMSSGDISDYNIQVSEYPDFRFPVSSIFNKLTSQQHYANVPKWKVPRPGLLNPNTIYYWRVAVRNTQGIWSDWSEVWSFTIHAVGVPLNPSYATEGDSIVLRWQTNPAGKEPVKFYILAGNERGFSYHDTLIIDSTNNNFYVIKDRFKILDYAFYRIVAAASDYSKSGISDLIAIQDDLLYTIPELIQNSDSISIRLVKIERTDFYGRSGPPEYTPHLISDSLLITSVALPAGLVLENNVIKGKVTAYGDTIIDIAGKSSLSNKDFFRRIELAVNFSPEFVGLSRYVVRADSMFVSRIIANDPDGDSLVYSSVNLPPWMVLDSISGILIGIPSAGEAGDYFITIMARDDRGGVRESDFKITVLAPSPYFTIQSVSDSVFVVGQTSVATANVVVNSEYTGQINYQLRRGPDWLKIDSVSGEISGTPSVEDYEKDYIARIRVTDTNYFYSDYTFSVAVIRKNTIPRFLTFPDTICYYQTHFKYQAQAIDTDTLFNDRVVKYVLLKAPYWLKIDSSGLLSGVVSDNIHRKYDVVVGAIDAFGDTSLQAFKLYVYKELFFQNYPNPFKASTTIRFKLPVRSNVELQLFNLAGQRIETLAKGTFNEGYHTITWNAGSRSTGVYFVNATINGLSDNRKFSVVRKMLVVN